QDQGFSTYAGGQHAFHVQVTLNSQATHPTFQFKLNVTVTTQPDPSGQSPNVFHLEALLQADGERIPGFLVSLGSTPTSISAREVVTTPFTITNQLLHDRTYG